MGWETVVGFEIHTELLTNTKVFCGCSTAFGQSPNTQTCPVCLGMPGSLPVLNRRAFELAMRAAVALNCNITRRTQFERKNYYYPDLPKNYQISQLRKNLGVDGWIDIEVEGKTKRVGIDNVHLEEDAGKNIHSENSWDDRSLVDLNRAGTPLLEIVTRPDLRTEKEAAALMEAMKSLLEYTEVSDCNMHEGRLRFEANISVRRAGDEKLGTKVEIKNLNSMKVVLKCIEVETRRQIDAIEAGERIVQETRLWDEAAATTRAMRSKEEANDYRYFPDPDLVEIVIDDAWLEAVQNELPELPATRRARFEREFGLTPYDAGVLTADKKIADYYEAAIAAHDNPKAIANWLMTETLRFLNEDAERSIADYPIPADHLGELVRLIDDGTISGKIAKDLYREMIASAGGARPAEIVKSKGMVQITDSGAIGAIVVEVLQLKSNAQSILDYQQGKERALSALTGQVMKISKGKANPQIVNELIRGKIRDLKSKLPEDQH